MNPVILLSIFIILQINDVITTALLLNRGGCEKNPLIAWFIKKFDYPLGIILPKLPATIAVVWASVSGLLPIYVLTLLCLFYIMVIINNINVLRKET